jgi:Cu(I)/Ag(I) efflux system protein CusF
MRRPLIATALVLAACVPAPSESADDKGRAMGAMNAAAQGPIRSTGVVTALDARTVTLNHEPIAAIGWPAMTMRFTAENPAMLAGMRVGDRVTFELKSAEDTQTIVRIEKQ